MPTTKSCFVCGSANPIGLKLHFETDGKMVRAHLPLKDQEMNEALADFDAGTGAIFG